MQPVLAVPRCNAALWYGLASEIAFLARATILASWSFQYASIGQYRHHARGCPDTSRLQPTLQRCCSGRCKKVKIFAYPSKRIVRVFRSFGTTRRNYNRSFGRFFFVLLRLFLTPHRVRFFAAYQGLCRLFARCLFALVGSYFTLILNSSS